MALYAGAFDERIALTIAQESGGGGAAAWRVPKHWKSRNLGADQSCVVHGRTVPFAQNVEKLPFDHHELMAMIAHVRYCASEIRLRMLADESGFVSCKAAKRVWDTFGISDRFGYSIVAGHRIANYPLPAP
jgi:hypothetical protein